MDNEIKDLIDYMKSDVERRKAEKEDSIEKDRQQLEVLRQGFEGLKVKTQMTMQNLEVFRYFITKKRISIKKRRCNWKVCTRGNSKEEKERSEKKRVECQ